MQYSVIFTPEAQDQLAALYRFIAAAASPEAAERYTNAIVTYCEGLNTIPNRGTCRDDIRSGLIGVYYGGQDYESALQADLAACLT